MVGKQEDFYKRLRQKVQKWARSKEGRRSEYAEFILLAPDLFHLLLKLSLDKDVPVKEKAKLAVAIAYFVSPVDLLPEWIVGPIGYMDDVGLAVFVIHSILQETDEEIVTRHWAGDADLLETVRTFTGKADQMLGSGLWGRLKRLVEPPGRGRVAPVVRPAAQPARSDAARATERSILDPTEKEPAKTVTATKKTAASKKAAKKTATAKKAAKKSTKKKEPQNGGDGSKPEV